MGPTGSAAATEKLTAARKHKEAELASLYSVLQSVEKAKCAYNMSVTNVVLFPNSSHFFHAKIIHRQSGGRTGFPDSPERVSVSFSALCVCVKESRDIHTFESLMEGKDKREFQN